MLMFLSLAAMQVPTPDIANPDPVLCHVVAGRVELLILSTEIQAPPGLSAEEIAERDKVRRERAALLAALNRRYGKLTITDIDQLQAFASSDNDAMLAYARACRDLPAKP